MAEIAFMPTAELPAPIVSSVHGGSSAEASVTAAPVTAAPVACEAAPALAQAPAPVAIAVLETPAAPHAAPQAPTLTDAAANDIAAALATAQRARSRAKSNSRGPRPSDLIEKKIVIRRDRWDALVQLTDTLKNERGVRAEASEVAAIVLEAGLGAIIEESRNKPSPVAASPVAASPVAATPVAASPRASTRKAKPAKAARASAGTSKIAKIAKVAGQRGGRSKARRAPRPTRAAPAKPRAFKHEELDGIKRLVRGLGSDRSVQRTLALWLGAHPTKGGLAVPIEDLRSLCREFKVYDTANFAQNMKKDSSFFTEVRDRAGDRLGYSLTAAGVNACSGLFAGSR